MAPKVPKHADSYEATLYKLEGELAGLLVERDAIGKRILDLRSGISVMKRLMAQNSTPSQIRRKGLTDSVRTVMKGSAWLTPKEIREALKQQGINVAAYSNIFAEIHVILTRLLKSAEVEVDNTSKPLYRGSKKGG